MFWVNTERRSDGGQRAGVVVYHKRLLWEFSNFLKEQGYWRRCVSSEMCDGSSKVLVVQL